MSVAATSGLRGPAPVVGHRAGLRACAVLGILALELLIIGSVRFFTEFGCTRTLGVQVCGIFDALVVRGIAVLSLVVLFGLAARRGMLADILRRTGPVWPWPWAALQIAGFALILSPLLPWGPGFGAGTPALFAWGAGAVLATVGAVFWLVPPADWPALWRGHGPALGLLVLVGLVSPELVSLLDRMWAWGGIVDISFRAVVWILEWFGAPFVDPDRYLIGLRGFVVEVGKSCSGLQGMALIAGFLVLYLALQRHDLRLSRAWILLPVGIALSFALNIVRITLLLLIGAFQSPELAVRGFHSHAGWLFFTLLAFGLIIAAQRIAWFHPPVATGAAPAPSPAPALPPLLRDPAAILIVPFIVLLVSSLIPATFVSVSGLWYPVQAGAMAAALVLFAPAAGTLVSRPDLPAIGLGVLVGVIWIATGDGAAGAGADRALAQALAALPPAAFALWALCRVAGAVLLVPVIEECFFRGYLLRRLDGSGWPARFLALAVSSLLFAALHERWLAAAAAGLVFGLLMLRRNRLADPIAAHIAANAVLALWAILQRDLAGL